MKDLIGLLVGYVVSICIGIHPTVPCIACLNGRGQAITVEYIKSLILFWKGDVGYRKDMLYMKDELYLNIWSAICSKYVIYLPYNCFKLQNT